MLHTQKKKEERENLPCFYRLIKQHHAISIDQSYRVQLSNQYYQGHIQRSPPPAAERRQILPYLHPTASPCEHNLPTPCPPSTPILIQWTNSGRNLDIHVVKGPEDSLIQTLHSDLFRQQAMTILKQLNISPAVESVSPTLGSRHDHSFYICRLCCKSITHIMNIGAMLHHLTYYHITDDHTPRDELENKAFNYLFEIRHLLKQTIDNRIFSIIRASSDSLPIISWRGNKANSGTNKLTMGTITALDRSPTEGNQRPLPTPTSTSRPPTYRSNQVNNNNTPLSRSISHMISTGLSLNLDYENSSSSTPRLEYAKGITSTDTPLETPIDTVTDDVNTYQQATSSPRTRNGGVRKGIFDKHHNFRRNYS